MRTFLRSEWFLWVIIVLNLIVVLLYALWNIFRKKNKSTSFQLRCLVMILAPVAGVFYFFFGWLYFRLFFRKPVDLEDVIFSKDRVKTYLKADEDHERNFVPLEEAIAVTDTTNTRMLMLEVVRRDIGNSLNSISLALNSEDSEVSHYAASVLRETLSRLDSDFQKLYNRAMELEEEIREYDEEDEPLRTAAGMQAARLLYPDRYPMPVVEETAEDEVPEPEDEEDEDEELEEITGDDLMSKVRRLLRFLKLKAKAAKKQIAKAKKRAETRKEKKKQQKEASAVGDLEDEHYEDVRKKDSTPEFYKEEAQRERNKQQAYIQGLLARDGVPEEDTSIEAKLNEEMECARDLVSDMHSVLEQHVLSELDQKRHIDMLYEMAQLVELRDMMSSSEIEAAFLEMLSVSDFEKCWHYCDMSAKLYPLALTTFTTKLKLAYTTGDNELFFTTLDDLKRSRIVLDHDTMEMIRTFM